MKTSISLWLYVDQFFLEWEMFEPEVVGKIKTHILCSKNFFKDGAICEIMWKNIVDPGRPHFTISRIRMHIACWVPKA